MNSYSPSQINSAFRGLVLAFGVSAMGFGAMAPAIIAHGSSASPDGDAELEG